MDPRELIDRLVRLYGQLTAPEEHGRMAIPAWVRAPFRWGVVFYRELERDRAFERAASLAYGTILGLVPLLMLLVSLIKLAGFWQTDGKVVESFIFGSVLGDIPQVKNMLLPALQTASLGGIGVIGTVGWLYVAFRMYLVMERTFCDIFRVPVERTMAQRLANFYVSITLVPLLLASVALGSFQAASRVNMVFMADVATMLMPIALLTLAIKLLPCTEVRWTPALVGGTIAGALIQLGAWGMALYIRTFLANDPTMVLYGSIGVIPVFLTWLWLLWVCVLLGVEVAHVAQDYRSLVRVELEQRRAEQDKARIPAVADGLETAAAVAWFFVRGKAPVEADKIAQRCRIAEYRALQILEILARAGVVVRADTGWTVARAPSDVPVSEVVERWQATTGIARRGTDALQEHVQTAIRGALDGNLAEAADRWLPPEAEAPSEVVPFERKVR